MSRRKSIPSYRRHSSGQARVTINGRDYLLGPHGTRASHREYDRLIAEYLASGRSSSFGVESAESQFHYFLSSATTHTCNRLFGR